MSQAASPVQETLDPPAVPRLIAPGATPVRVGLAGRFWAALLCVACLLVLVAAAHLTPDPAGWGREGRLMMEPCAFRLRTGLPCAGCGMTTSFSHFVRGDVLGSLWVQPFATLLALATMITVWIAGYIAVTGRPVHKLLSRLLRRPAMLIVAVVALAIAAWGWKIVLTRAGLDGWS